MLRNLPLIFALFILSTRLFAGEKPETGERYVEKNVAFSFLIPKGWKVYNRDDFGRPTRQAAGALADGFAPNILFAPKLDVSPKTFERQADQWIIDAENFQLVSRANLKSKAGGIVKLVMDSAEDASIRKSFYFCEASEGKSFLAFCTVKAATFADYDPVLDACIQSFALEKVETVAIPDKHYVDETNHYTIDLPGGMHLDRNPNANWLMGNGHIDGFMISFVIVVKPAKGTIEEQLAESYAKDPSAKKIDQREFVTTKGLKGLRATLVETEGERVSKGFSYCLDDATSGKRYLITWMGPQKPDKFMDIFDAAVKSFVIDAK